jgi:ankyrin repeat protein
VCHNAGYRFVKPVLLILMITCREKEKSGGFSALHHAVIHGHLKGAEILLSRGADMNAQDDDGFTVQPALYQIIRPSCSASWQPIQHHLSSRSYCSLQCLHHSCRRGFKSMVELLLGQGANPNVTPPPCPDREFLSVLCFSSSYSLVPSPSCCLPPGA